MSKVTEKNTKKEIMEYVKELEAKLAKKAELNMTTADVQAQTKVKEQKETAKELIEANILNEETTQKYNDLMDTLEKLDDEIKEAYGIKRSAHALEALLIAYNEKNEELMKKSKDKKEELEAEFNKNKATLDEKLAEIGERIKKAEAKEKERDLEIRQELKVIREREEEKYQYDLKRKREKENDEWEDKKAAREKELKDREDAIKEREVKVETMEQEIEKLTQEIEILEQEKEEAVKQAFKDGQKDAEKVCNIKIEKEKQNATWEAKMAEKEIETLKTSLEETKQANRILQDKLDQSYERQNSVAIESAKSSAALRNTEK